MNVAANVWMWMWVRCGWGPRTLLSGAPADQQPEAQRGLSQRLVTKPVRTASTALGSGPGHVLCTVAPGAHGCTKVGPLRPSWSLLKETRLAISPRMTSPAPILNDRGRPRS